MGVIEDWDSFCHYCQTECGAGLCEHVLAQHPGSLRAEILLEDSRGRPYCQLCGRRCHADRMLPDGTALPLATCSGGAAVDRAQCGYDHTTAIDPLTQAVAGDPFRRPGA